MFDIRKIQENVIYESVKAESDAETADEIVYGRERTSNREKNPDWVKSAMHRMESRFEPEMIKTRRLRE